jgi:hypothetical protein
VTTTSSSFTRATIAVASLHSHSSVAALPLRRCHICVRPLLGARPTASATPPLLKWVLNCVRSVSLFFFDKVRSVSLIRRDRVNPHLEIIFSL